MKLEMVGKYWFRKGLCANLKSLDFLMKVSIP